ncbi:MAG: FAD-dependent oxidoreductase [Acidimicrobiales bacterium]
MHRVVVVGAGFAGLAAAYSLVRHDVDVEVMDARPRVGGRVWTRALDNGELVGYRHPLAPTSARSGCGL